MDLSKLTLQEALDQGVITRDSWNDESWEVDMPEWRRALELAASYHKKAGNVYEDRSKKWWPHGENVPYIKLIQGVLRILIDEAKCTGDDFLTTAALYNILAITECNRQILIEEFGEKTVERIEGLQKKEDESFREQLIRMVQFAEEKGEGQLVSCVFLAVKLYEERTIDICPLKDWEEDVPYYQKITDELQDYGLKVYKDKKWNTAIFLSNLLLEQLSENRDFSRNRNKTAEELYAGWDD